MAVHWFPARTRLVRWGQVGHFYTLGCLFSASLWIGMGMCWKYWKNFNFFLTVLVAMEGRTWPKVSDICGQAFREWNNLCWFCKNGTLLQKNVVYGFWFLFPNSLQRKISTLTILLKLSRHLALGMLRIISSRGRGEGQIKIFTNNQGKQITKISPLGLIEHLSEIRSPTWARGWAEPTPHPSSTYVQNSIFLLYLIWFFLKLFCVNIKAPWRLHALAERYQVNLNFIK